MKQDYNYLNLNGELSGNKLYEPEEKKVIIYDSCIVEPDVMLCSVQMYKVQMQALFIDGQGKEINFTCFSLKIILFVFLLLKRMS